MSAPSAAQNYPAYDDPPAEITILGVGNIVLRDEGFGVRVVEYLDENYDFPKNVQLLDGGTLGMELLSFITGTKKLLVLDAVKAGEEEGVIYAFRGDEVAAHFQHKLSAHEIGIQDVLTLLTLTDKAIPTVSVIGAEPYCLDAGMSLSEKMSALVPKAATAAIDELISWGAVPTPKRAEGV